MLALDTIEAAHYLLTTDKPWSNLKRTTESFVLQVQFERTVFERTVVVFEGSRSLEPRPNLQADGVTLFQKDRVHPGSVRDSKVLGISCQLSTSEGMQMLAAANQVIGGWVMIDVGNIRMTSKAQLGCCTPHQVTSKPAGPRMLGDGIWDLKVKAKTQGQRSGL